MLRDVRALCHRGDVEDRGQLIATIRRGDLKRGRRG
jgi:hypothetical protein